MKLIVAVSGGVDSVVLLHTLIEEGEHELIVAHFDHGIRDDSAEDAVFVEKLAEQYSLPFKTRREELGGTASEELARSRRYAFLREVAKEHNATIATAHHMNDIAETIAINMTRGTGWRGVAVLDSGIYRPLLGLLKREIIAYAHEHGLMWHEDSTNASDAYLRNRIRRQIADDDIVLQLASLRAAQVALKKQIQHEIDLLALTSPYSRVFFTHIPKEAALECLRAVVRGALTRPQMERALLAIATHRPGKTYQAGSGVELHFTSRYFTV
jgi:tRNA(Ile)-lysidine synthase